MRLFHQEGIILDGIVHADHDGQTMKIVAKYFPLAIEMNDPAAHRVKLFKKKIISLGTLHKQLKGIGNKCRSRMLMYAIRHCDGQQLANFKQLMMNQFNHITNRDHSCCTHDVDYTPRNGFITDEAARGLLWVEFENIINIGERYVNNYGTNTVEAFNHEITKFCPKWSINFHTTYVLRGNLAALARLSPNYKLEIMNALQVVTVDNNTAERLLSEVDRKQYLSEWRRSTQYKQRKALARKRNREANKNRPMMENQNGDQHLENEVIQNYSYKNGGQLKRRERTRRRNGKQMEGQRKVPLQLVATAAAASGRNKR